MHKDLYAKEIEEDSVDHPLDDDLEVWAVSVREFGQGPKTVVFGGDFQAATEYENKVVQHNRAAVAMYDLMVDEETHELAKLWQGSGRGDRGDSGCCAVG